MTQQITYCNKCQEVGKKIAVDLKKEGNYWNHYVVGTNYTVRHWHMKECTGCKQMGISVLIVIVPFRKDDGSTGWKPQNPNGTEHEHGHGETVIPSPSGSLEGQGQVPLGKGTLETFEEIEKERKGEFALRVGTAKNGNRVTYTQKNEVAVYDLSKPPTPQAQSEPTAEELTLNAIQSVVNMIYQMQVDTNKKLDKLLLLLATESTEK